MELFRIENLSFKYPLCDEPALSNISFEILKGEFVVICGESGCGKTTLLKALKKELVPNGEKSGEVFYDNNRLEELSRQESAKTGYVFQEPEKQIVTDKVWHELAFGLENLNKDTGFIKRRVSETACYFGMENWLQKSTADLSGGETQLVNLASVTATAPEAVLLDEPTSQLDPIAAEEFISVLYRLNQELGITVVIAEHRLENLLSFADKAALLENGRLIFFDRPEKLGEALKGRRMFQSLPCSVRVFTALGAEGKTPVSVKQGRDFLLKNYKNDIRKQEFDDSCKSFSEKAFELKNVWFRYSKEADDILQGVDLTIHKNEIFCLLGSNGSGKTTLLNVMAGLLKPYQGSVLIQNKKIKKHKNIYRGVLSVLPQNPVMLFVKETVLEDYIQICEANGYAKSEIPEAVKEISEKLKIDGLLKKNPYDLSGGEKQKCALGKLLILNPSILLLDEPTKGLDADYKAELAVLLKAISDEGITIVIVTHDVEFAAAVSDRCGMLSEGKIACAAKPREFFNGNYFYTTSANRMARNIYDNVLFSEDIEKLCMLNGVKDEQEND